MMKRQGATASRAARALFAAWLDTPLGPMTAIGDEEALYLLEDVDRRGLERQIERLRVRTGAGIVPGRTAPIAQIEAELTAYFAGRSMRFATPLARFGSPFQNAVWDVLLAIPPGQTRSYAEIARAIGRPEAVRAAAQANGANQLAIVVPCHRVINADGALRLWRRAAAQKLAPRPRATIRGCGGSGNGVKPLHAIHARTDPQALRRRLLWHQVELRAVIGTWRQRHRDRRELQRLMSSGPHLIADIGMSRTHAEREAPKPFWRP